MDEEKLSILSQGRAVMERSGPPVAPDVGSMTFDALGLHLLHDSVPLFASVYLLCLPLGSQPLCSFHSPGRGWDRGWGAGKDTWPQRVGILCGLIPGSPRLDGDSRQVMFFQPEQSLLQH